MTSGGFEHENQLVSPHLHFSGGMHPESTNINSMEPREATSLKNATMGSFHPRYMCLEVQD